MHHPTEQIVYTKAFVTPFVELWLEREIMTHRSNDPLHYELILYCEATSTSCSCPSMSVIIVALYFDLISQISSIKNLMFIIYV